MAKGIRLARELGGDPKLHDALENMVEQLVIVLIERLGGEVTVPVSEIDGTGRFALLMDVDHDAQTFTFKTVNTK